MNKELVSLDEFGMTDEELFSHVDNSEAEAEKSRLRAIHTGARL